MQFEKTDTNCRGKSDLAVSGKPILIGLSIASNDCPPGYKGFVRTHFTGTDGGKTC